jgi:hypothetical protein
MESILDTILSDTPVSVYKKESSFMFKNFINSLCKILHINSRIPTYEVSTNYLTTNTQSVDLVQNIKDRLNEIKSEGTLQNKEDENKMSPISGPQ